MRYLSHKTMKNRTKSRYKENSPDIVSSEKTATLQLEWPHPEVFPGLPAKLIASQALKTIIY